MRTPYDLLLTLQVQVQEEKARLKRLKTIARDYLKVRKAAVGRCRRCNGSGHRVRIIARTGGRRTRTETCDACKGYGRYISEKHYLQLHFHLKSPAFRAQRYMLRNLENEAEQLQCDGPPALVTRTVLKEVALHGDSHGLAWVKVNREKTYSFAQWIWIAEPGGRNADWFLYDETVDGEWPDLTAPGPESGAPEVLLKEENERLKSALGETTLAHKVESAGRVGRKLYLEMSSSGIAAEDLQTSAAEDATKTARAIWAKGPSWGCIHWTFIATWRNDLGETEIKPYMHAEIEKSVFDRIVWKNLTTEEAFRVFHPQPLRHADWKVWQ